MPDVSAHARPVLVGPDKFKGTFTAPRVAAAIGRGLAPPDPAPVPVAA
jgi:glycerate kinase